MTTPAMPGAEEIGGAIAAVAVIVWMHVDHSWTAIDAANLTGSLTVLAVYLAGFLPQRK